MIREFKSLYQNVVKTPLKSEPLRAGLNGVFFIKSVFMRVCGTLEHPIQIGHEIRKGQKVESKLSKRMNLNPHV